MIDVKWICDHPQDFDEALNKRGLASAASQIIALDKSRREKITSMQNLQNAKNTYSKQFSQANHETLAELKNQIADITSQISELESQIEEDDNALQALLEVIPNILDESVPYGESEEMNVLIRDFGKIPEIEDPLAHNIIGQKLGMMNFAHAAKISGSRFVILSSWLAKMERALVSYMIDVHVNEFGFKEFAPPLLVRDHAMFCSGQLPKFEEESFSTTDGRRLIPTSEVPLVSMFMDSITPQEQLPIRCTAATHCFRSEAGASGKDTVGMIRMHQFTKVELVSITNPRDSHQELEYILNSAEEILKRLELPYRIMLLCSKDTGFAAAKTYDIEVWMPSQGKYREISSCSNCTDFQARRGKIRLKSRDGTNSLVHTLNGSGLAVGRTMIAIMENYQNFDGSITVPPVLVPYLGTKIIEPCGELNY
ncbi:Serine--tRNA ligase [Rickettsiales endosymbiont of Paramecium tredecaurelia]|uniref:serine--tRNA ligase n=1 Tax=Candidatus Sarmatiella mevalonica TaxID=2770581 RepID=UPI001921D5A0|nr:serine--tRNA ligase [Candidatus Sarmatiella mevalonica]MBL3284175.1 Serine--tRNA ligase [Candidatus Sarmatiella mevalonica]